VLSTHEHEEAEERHGKRQRKNGRIATPPDHKAAEQDDEPEERVANPPAAHAKQPRANCILAMPDEPPEVKGVRAEAQVVVL
jgi:hypothetical protein